MTDERRSTRRVRLSGVRVAFESASGGVHEADVANLSHDGLFVRSATPPPVGKRLSLDIKVAGEAAPWAALGRVVWVRQVDEGVARPAGMAVKFIDVEDAVVAAIDRLIAARERTEPGVGDKASAPVRERPVREKTMLGVGGLGVPSASVPRPASPAPSAPPKKTEALPMPATPSVPFVPSRERTVLGIGREGLGGDSREPSLAIDLVAKKPPRTPPRELSWGLPAEAPPASIPEAPRKQVQEPPPRELSWGLPAEAPPEPVAEAPRERVQEPHHEPVARAARVDEAPAIERRPAQAIREPLPAESSESSISEAAIPRRRSGMGWLLLLILLAGAGAAGYVYRAQLLPLWHQVVTTVMRKIR